MAVENVRVSRSSPDGFCFLVNVTMPHDFVEGERHPAMFWFYPREYEDQESYDERGRTYNRNAFPNFGTRSMLDCVAGTPPGGGRGAVRDLSAGRAAPPRA